VSARFRQDLPQETGTEKEVHIAVETNKIKQKQEFQAGLSAEMAAQ
jgi:hypothetical protein